jgi:uncharacterized membrane protein
MWKPLHSQEWLCYLHRVSEPGRAGRRFPIFRFRFGGRVAATLVLAFRSSILYLLTKLSGSVIRIQLQGWTAMSTSPLLPVHIVGGIVGILSGTATMSPRKGSPPRHALAGKVFVAAMLTMASIAVYLALMKNQMSNVLAGTFAFYLVLTAWATARRGDAETGIFDWVALLIPSLVGIGLWILGLVVVYGHAKPATGVPSGCTFSWVR